MTLVAIINTGIADTAQRLPLTTVRSRTESAQKAKVNVFHRFALMQRWYEAADVPLAELDDGGQLHTSEWATKCVALALSAAIAGAPQMAV